MNVKIKTDLIQEYREENDLTIKEFCKRCKIASTTYHAIMTGKTNFNVSVLVKIANLLNIRLLELFEQ